MIQKKQILIDTIIPTVKNNDKDETQLRETKQQHVTTLLHYNEIKENIVDEMFLNLGIL